MNYFVFVFLSTVKVPADVDTSTDKLLQPDVFEDFPTIEDSAPKIPHNIHQTAISSCISEDNIINVKSFVDNNPDWKYYFWTDESARLLIEHQHPYLLDIWDNVDTGVKRADILRYVVLYEYGGVYADIDVENLRPLDRVTRKYNCIVPTEPLEHSAFMYDRPFVMNNGIILCSKGHPFLKQLLNNLKDTINKDVMSATGPLFVTKQFIKYNKNMHKTEIGGPAKDFISALGSGAYEETDVRAVYVPNTHYFTDNIDAWYQGGSFAYKCRMFWFQQDLQQRACIDLVHKGLYRKNTKFVYTKHHWHHSWCSGLFINLYRYFFRSSCVEISRLVPSNQLTTLTSWY